MEEHSYAISSVHEEVNNSSPGGGSDSVSGGSGEYSGQRDDPVSSLFVIKTAKKFV